MNTPAADPPQLEGRLASLLAGSGLAPLRLAGRTLLPLVQGGMGVGVSAHRLAGAVAAEGGVGTISSVDLRRHHPDLMERTQRPRRRATPPSRPSTKPTWRRSRARSPPRATVAGGRGLLAINVMRAVSAYAASVKRRWKPASTPWWWAPACRWTCPTWRRTTRARR